MSEQQQFLVELENSQLQLDPGTLMACGIKFTLYHENKVVRVMENLGDFTASVAHLLMKMKVIKRSSSQELAFFLNEEISFKPQSKSEFTKFGKRISESLGYTIPTDKKTADYIEISLLYRHINSDVYESHFMHRMVSEDEQVINETWNQLTERHDVVLTIPSNQEYLGLAVDSQDLR